MGGPCDVQLSDSAVFEYVLFDANYEFVVDRTLPATNDATITIALGKTDFDAISAQPKLAIDQTSVFAEVLPKLVADMRGNLAAATPKYNPVAATGFVADKISPKL